MPDIAKKLDDRSLMRVVNKLLPEYKKLLTSDISTKQNYSKTVTNSFVKIVKSIKNKKACLSLLVPIMMIDSKINSTQSPAKEVIKAIIQNSDPLELDKKLKNILESDRHDHKISLQTIMETIEIAQNQGLDLRNTLEKESGIMDIKVPKKIHAQTDSNAIKFLMAFGIGGIGFRALQYRLWQARQDAPNNWIDEIEQTKTKSKAKPKAKPETNVSNFDPNSSVLIIDPKNKQYTVIEKETFSKNYEKYCTLYDDDPIFWVNNQMLMPLSITFDKTMNNTNGQPLSKNRYDALLLSEQPDVLQTSTRCETPDIIVDLYKKLGLSQALPNEKTQQMGADELNTSKKLNQALRFVLTKFDTTIEDINTLLKETEPKKSFNMSFNMNEDYATRLDALKTYISYLKTNNHNDMEKLTKKISEIETILDNMHINPKTYSDQLTQSDDLCVTTLNEAGYTHSKDLSVHQQVTDSNSEKAINALLAEDRLMDLLGLLFDVSKNSNDTANYFDTLDETDRSLICRCFDWQCDTKEIFRDKILNLISESRRIEFDFIVSANSKPVNLEVKAWNLLNKDRSHNEQKIASLIQRIKNQLKKQNGYYNSHCVFISDRTDPHDIEQEQKALQFVAKTCNLTIKALKKSDIDSQTKLKAIITTASEEASTLFIMPQNAIKSAIKHPDGHQFKTIANATRLSKRNTTHRGEDAERLLRELFKKHSIHATSGLVFTDTDTAMSSR